MLISQSLMFIFNNMMKCIFVFIVTAALLTSMAGCEFKGKEVESSTSSAVVNDKSWQPKPIAIRIYPSTRFVLKDKKEFTSRPRQNGISGPLQGLDVKVRCEQFNIFCL